jgi:hypothetical protein
MLQYTQKICYENDLESNTASKRAFDVKKKFRQFKIKYKVLLYIPSPPKGNNAKFYTPWRGVYKVVEKTSGLTYIVRKKGGRNRTAHVNRLKFYDPKNSHKDPEVLISIEEDENNQEISQDNKQEENTTKSKHKEYTIPKYKENMRITRSRTRALNNNAKK